MTIQVRAGLSAIPNRGCSFLARVQTLNRELKTDSEPQSLKKTQDSELENLGGLAPGLPWGNFTSVFASPAPKRQVKCLVRPSQFISTRLKPLRSTGSIINSLPCSLGLRS
jgi:hypothetical protein